MSYPLNERQNLVRLAGLEPARLSATDFKSVMATNYITVAVVYLQKFWWARWDSNPRSTNYEFAALGL